MFERARAEDADTVIVAINRGGAAATATVAAPGAWSSPVVDALTGDAIDLTDGRLTVTVPARSARVITAR